MAYNPLNPNGQALMANSSPVVIASDQSAIPISGALTANQSVNVAQINGATATMGNGIAGTGVQRVTIASDSTGQIVALGNVASAATDSGNPVKTGGKYNSSVITLTDGQRGDVQLDVNGFLRATLATLIAGEDLTNNVLKVEQRFSYTNITSATTTTVKSGAGFLHGIVLNTVAASGVITIYDNTAGSGTKIATITNPLTLLAQGPLDATYDIAFSTGLTIVTTGTQDVTVSWR